MDVGTDVVVFGMETNHVLDKEEAFAGQRTSRHFRIDSPSRLPRLVPPRRVSDGVEVSWLR